MSTNLIYVADCKYKGNDICVFRDQHGKYHIKVNGIITKKRLLANAMVRYFCQAMHHEQPPIPKHVYFNIGKFFDRKTRISMSEEFYNQWKERAWEFPCTAYNT